MPRITQSQMALLHIAKAQLLMSDADYIQILMDHGGVASSKFLESSRFERVLDAFKAQGFVATVKDGKRRRAKDDGSKARLLHKINDQLNKLSLPWSYAVAIAKSRFSVDRLEWCTAAQLHKIVAMLTYHQQRQNKRMAECAQ